MLVFVPLLILATACTTALSLLGMWASEKIANPVEFFGGFLALDKTYNAGIAFGIQLPSPWKERLIVLALLIVLLIAYADREAKNRPFAYGMICGGAIGNLVDRFLDGTVTDIFRIGTFPTFNIADASISLGVALLIWDMFLDR